MSNTEKSLETKEPHNSVVVHNLRTRSTVYGKNCMVATNSATASQLGLQVLRNGGNAVDAAITIAACLALVEPCSTGLGGDAFLLHYSSKENKVSGLNGSGRSASSLPSLSDIMKQHPDLGPERNGNFPRWPSAYKCHGLGITVPGAVQLWEDALSQYGTYTLKECLEPVIELATNGFIISEITAELWQEEAQDCLKAVNEFKKCQNAGKKPNITLAMPVSLSGECLETPKAGQLIKNENFANVLKIIATNGAKAGFYSGEIGQKIVKATQDHGGYLSMEDLKKHRSDPTEPISVDYEGYKVHEHPPNGQGIIALQALNIMTAFLKENGQSISTLSPSELTHLQIESLRLAFADGHHFVTDLESMKASKSDLVNKLLSESYARTRSSLISMEHRNENIKHGFPINEKSDTISFQVVDQFGNAVSFVNSNYMGFGTGIVPDGCGFSLQNRGMNFSLSTQNLNTLAPNKRPYHTIIPAMITKKTVIAKGTSSEDTRDDFYATFTNMGGFMQPQGHLQIVCNLINHCHTAQAAIDQPRFCIIGHNPEEKESTESIFFEKGFQSEVEKFGHRVQEKASKFITGRAQIILKDEVTGYLQGGTDSRGDAMDDTGELDLSDAERPLWLLKVPSVLLKCWKGKCREMVKSRQQSANHTTAGTAPSEPLQVAILRKETVQLPNGKTETRMKLLPKPDVFANNPEYVEAIPNWYNCVGTDRGMRGKSLRLFSTTKKEISSVPDNTMNNNDNAKKTKGGSVENIKFQGVVSQLCSLVVDPRERKRMRHAKKRHVRLKKGFPTNTGRFTSSSRSSSSRFGNKSNLTNERRVRILSDKDAFMARHNMDRPTIHVDAIDINQATMNNSSMGQNTMDGSSTIDLGVDESYARYPKLSRDELKNRIFKAFTVQEAWSLRELNSGRTTNLKQPVQYLKEVIKEICDYHHQGIYHQKYTLKREYTV
eukprot:g904.t1